MARWYPNGDGDKCSGSFKIALEYPAADGKVSCGCCGRRVGLRNPLTRQLAQHKLPKQAAPWSVEGGRQNKAQMAVDIETRGPKGEVAPKLVLANYFAQQAHAAKTMEGFLRRAAALGADIGPHDDMSFPGTLQEQAAKMNLACSTSGLFFGKREAAKVFGMKIQDILGAFLSAHGKHALATEAFESTSRAVWNRLGDEAIRSAPEYNRTHVAQVVKLALDDPENGGPGDAQDFEIRPEARRTTLVLGAVAMPDTKPMYRGYMMAKLGGATDCGLASDDIENLKRRIVGMYVARTITVVEAK